MSYEEVLAALSPELRRRLSVASNAPNIEYQPTPSLGLNKALNGGFPYGRQVLVWGNKSSGKSSLCLQMIGEAQRAGKTCAWIDSETAFDKSWSGRLGVDNDELIYSTASTVNEMTDTGVALMKAGVDLIVVDSISGLLPAIYFDKPGVLKELDKTQQIGAFAKDMDHAVKMLNYANNRVKDTLLVLISQVRNQISPNYTAQKPMGGKAVEFYSSVVIRLTSSESESQAIQGTTAVGDRLIQEKIGRKVTWQITFSKTSPGFRSGEYNFYFSGDRVGVNSVVELLTMAVDWGLVEKPPKSGWYTFSNGAKIQGEEEALRYIVDNPTIYNELMTGVFK